MSEVIKNVIQTVEIENWAILYRAERRFFVQIFGFTLLPYRIMIKELSKTALKSFMFFSFKFILNFNFIGPELQG